MSKPIKKVEEIDCNHNWLNLFKYLKRSLLAKWLELYNFPTSSLTFHLKSDMMANPVNFGSREYIKLIPNQGVIIVSRTSNNLTDSFNTVLFRGIEVVSNLKNPENIQGSTELRIYSKDEMFEDRMNFIALHEYVRKNKKCGLRIAFGYIENDKTTYEESYKIKSIT